MLLNQADPRSWGKVTMGNCGNGESREVQAWCTRHLVAGVIHSFPTPSACPPAIGPRTPLNTRGRWVIPIWLQFIYDWWLLKLSATVLDDWSCLMQPRRVVYTHTHTSWRHQAASVVWASPGVERRDAWQINCWYRISHSALRLIRSLIRRRWPDGAPDCCLPSIGHDY